MKQKGRWVVGDHYVLSKQKSHFIYSVSEVTIAFAIQRTYIHDEFLSKYPDLEPDLKASSYMFYKKWIYKPIFDHRMKLIEHNNIARADGHIISYIRTLKDLNIMSIWDYRSEKLYGP